MSATPSTLEIHVHSVDGHVTKFLQKDSNAVPRLLDHIQPGKVFAQRQLTIASGQSLAIFPCVAIARVDLVMDGFPDWEFHHGVTNVEEISEDEFHLRYSPEKARSAAPLPPGAPVVTFGEIELANGERVFSEIHTHVELRLPVEQDMFFHQILTAPSLYSKRRGGGAILLNPVNIVRLTFYPGPLTPPSSALPAELLSV